MNEVEKFNKLLWLKDPKCLFRDISFNIVFSEINKINEFNIFFLLWLKLTN